METWEAKTPDETVSRRWEPVLADNEGISTVAVAVDSGTVTATAESEVRRGKRGVTVTVVGGAAGETARVSVTVTTTENRTRIGVFHIAVRAEAPLLGNTARDVINFAMRKITGNGNDPTADELDDALERLNGLWMLWRIQGLDVGIAKELTANDTLDIPDAFVTAIKWCLREELHDFYGVALSAVDVMRVTAAKNAMLAKLTTFDNLNYDGGLLREAARWDFTRGY